MLSIVHAAEAQFRFDSEARAHEHAILASIREHRRDRLAERTTAGASVSRPRLTPTVWARPIHAPSFAVA